MNKYKVEVPYLCWVTVEVEAEDESHAEELACDEINVTSLVGNNGHDKLIGVSGEQSIECQGDPYVDGQIKSYIEELN